MATSGSASWCPGVPSLCRAYLTEAKQWQTMTHPVYSGVFEARHCTEMSPNVANTRVLLEAKIYSTVCSWCLKLKFSGIYILSYIVFCIFGFERHGLWMLVSLIPRLRYVQPRLKTTRKLPSLEPAHTVRLFQTSSLVVHPGHHVSVGIRRREMGSNHFCWQSWHLVSPNNNHESGENAASKSDPTEIPVKDSTRMYRVYNGLYTCCSSQSSLRFRKWCKGIMLLHMDVAHPASWTFSTCSDWSQPLKAYVKGEQHNVQISKRDKIYQKNTPATVIICSWAPASSSSSSLSSSSWSFSCSSSSFISIHPQNLSHLYHPHQHHQHQHDHAHYHRYHRYYPKNRFHRYNYYNCHQQKRALRHNQRQCPFWRCQAGVLVKYNKMHSQFFPNLTAYRASDLCHQCYLTCFGLGTASCHAQHSQDLFLLCRRPCSYCSKLSVCNIRSVSSPIT